MITDRIKYIGVNDTQIDLFEGQYRVPSGMCYNSYAIIDEKIAVMDSVDANFTRDWLDNIKTALSGRTPDYLVVQHMEPDHSANIVNFLNEYPDSKVVSSDKAFKIMKNFFGTDFEGRRIVVGDGDTLSLGEGSLTFISAPMVHWPDVIMTYDERDRVLFSADGFGKFGTYDAKEDWTDEARRYYIGIVAKYGAQVDSVLKKAEALDIQKICPLHGPVLTENLDFYLTLYKKWARYEPEEDGVVIAYTSVYGNTRTAVLHLEELLKKKGAKVTVFDLARCDMAEAVACAFKYSKLVLATTTYNADIFPFMREFINHLTERGFKNRKVAFIENGSWAPMATKIMRSALEGSKNLEYASETVKILSAPDDENYRECARLADELCKSE